MFEREPKNRLMTPKEMEDELFFAKLFKRHPRRYILDRPFYPYVPQMPKHMVNFDLNFQEK